MLAKVRAAAAIPNDLAAIEPALVLYAELIIYNALRNAGLPAGDVVAVRDVTDFVI
jgi:propanol-preferring alcohol dehydrogenase